MLVQVRDTVETLLPYTAALESNYNLSNEYFSKVLVTGHNNFKMHSSCLESQVCLLLYSMNF